jgi:hypothetical protein
MLPTPLKSCKAIQSPITMTAGMATICGPTSTFTPAASRNAETACLETGWISRSTMRHLMLARLAKEAPYLLPLVDAVKRGVTIRQPLKREAFSPPRSARAILWLCDHPSGGPGDFDADSIIGFAEISLYRFVIGTDEPEPSMYQRAANYAETLASRTALPLSRGMGYNFMYKTPICLINSMCPSGAPLRAPWN